MSDPGDTHATGAGATEGEEPADAPRARRALPHPSGRDDGSDLRRVSPAQPLFLARSRYRHRRLRDVARLMPVLAAIVWLIPLLWRAGPSQTGGTASAAVFVFVGWGVLIVAAFVLARLIDLSDAADPPG